MKTVLHVNRHVIARNQKTGQSEPPLSVKTYKETLRAKEVRIEGPSVLIYSPDKPLPCGATVWIETEGRVEIAR